MSSITVSQWLYAHSIYLRTRVAVLTLLKDITSPICSSAGSLICLRFNCAEYCFSETLGHRDFVLIGFHLTLVGGLESSWLYCVAFFIICKFMSVCVSFKGKESLRFGETFLQTISERHLKHFYGMCKQSQTTEHFMPAQGPSLILQLSKCSSVTQHSTWGFH